MKNLKFTNKALEAIKMFEGALKRWLAFSEMTKSDLLEYKTAEKIYVEKTQEGFCLMCVKNGGEEQIGYGLSKDSTEGVEMLFLYVGAILDYENNFTTHFGDEILKSLNK